MSTVTSTATWSCVFGIVLLAVWSTTGAVAVEFPEAVASASCVACGKDVPRRHSAYSEEAWRAIADGEILTSAVPQPSPDGTARSIVEVAGLVAHPPSRVWAVLTDVESWANWQPSTREARIVRVDGNHVWVDERLSFFLVGIRYRMIYTLEPDVGIISWILDETTEHDIGGTTGAWMLEPIAGGLKTLLTYRAWIDTRRRVPEFIEAFLLKRLLPRLIENVRTEVDRRRGSEPHAPDDAHYD
jgi:uncharacterized protein YndB with AHSA1/START domain